MNRALPLLPVLLFVAQSALAIGGTTQFERLPETVQPTSQQIHLRLDPDAPSYSGSVTIDLDVQTATREIRFHALDIEFQRLELVGEGDPIPLEIGRGDAGLVVATAADELASGLYQLTAEFTAGYNRNSVGLYQIDLGEDHYLATQFEMQDARRAFPVFDEPAFKIPFQMTLTVPEGMTAVSNTPVTDREANDGWVTHRFARTPPISSYLVAIGVGPYEAVPIAGMGVPGKIYTVRQQAHLAQAAAGETAKILKALERYFGRPYPYAKLDFLAVPEFPFGAMENVGLVIYRDDILLLDPATASLDDRAGMTGVIAHELAHMWYGNLVTMDWWNDLWLNEAFATWMASKITNDLYPEFRGELTLRQNYAMRTDARPSTLPIRKPVHSEADIMDGLGLAYSKGMSVLGMVETWIGETDFRTGVLDYLQQHEFENAEAADLWLALSRASGKDVESVLASFLEQSGFPLVEVLHEDGTIRLAQHRFLNEGVEAANLQWDVPLRLKLKTSAGTMVRPVLLDQSTAEVSIHQPVEWIYPDAGAVGYYRWNVPADDLRAIADDAADHLETRERIGFIANAGGLLDAGEIGGNDYLAVLGAMGRDPEPEVVHAVIARLNWVREDMLPGGHEDQFAAYVRETLQPALERFGLQRKEGEISTVPSLRTDLMLWLGREGKVASVIQQAREMTEQLLRDRAAVDPALSDTALKLAALDGDAALFERYVSAYRDAKTPDMRTQLLVGLGSFSDPALRERALRFTLSNDVRPPDLLIIPNAIADTDRAGKSLVFDWTLAEFDAIAERLPPFRVPQLPLYLPTDCRLDRLEQAQAFFSAASRARPGTERALEKLADKVTDCHRLRERVGQQVVAHLGERASSEH